MKKNFIIIAALIAFSNLTILPVFSSDAMDNISSASKKAVDATKNATHKTIKATKSATKKTVKATKSATNKTVKATKKFTEKTVDGTKDIIDNLNPNKPVTLEGLEKNAKIKTLKNERNELKSAYNSRIKDTKAKIKATEKSTVITDVERQDRIHTLSKQIEELTRERDDAIKKYNDDIAKIKAE